MIFLHSIFDFWPEHIFRHFDFFYRKTFSKLFCLAKKIQFQEIMAKACGANNEIDKKSEEELKGKWMSIFFAYF